eukprot:TRINITY_DN4675_c0_g1_i13.p1 TRINITY_DN4675_c0_g1~~TRINITY_DN4675_c0_g1_i13.p1  ORF type:complete len:538 (+),score=168.37 TRINITY_DN4675_c0_g1_i13:176-1789(+)
MGKLNKINLISDGFQPVPTSDKPSITPSRVEADIAADLPVVVTARNLKKAKRNKVLKISLMIVIGGALVTTLAIVFASQGANIQETTTDPVAGADDTHVHGESGPLKSMSQQADSGNRQAKEMDGDGQESGFDFLKLAKASAEVGMKLYKEEKEKKDGNLLFSPLSVQSALSMVALGSKGSTMDQLMDLLGGKKSEEELRYIRNLQELKSQFGNALKTIESSANYTIESANSLFVQEDYKLMSDLVSDLQDNFGAKISLTDYTNPAAAAALINTFVKEKTHEKILNLISPDSVDSNTKMVLVNALYFKGMWKEYFDKQETTKHTFHLTDEKSIETDFMHQKEDMHVGRYKGKTIVALPYSGDRFVMYLFIPHDIKELDSFFEQPVEDENVVEEALSVLENLMVEDSEGISDALDISKFESRKVDLLLPKFKIESTMELKDNLEKLGVKDAFSEDKADLSGISGKRDLFLSDAIHKAFIEVNEEGSEAAAATGLMAVARMLGPLPIKAHFDRPFVFFIKDQETGMILFQGRVVDPSQS